MSLLPPAIVSPSSYIRIAVARIDKCRGLLERKIRAGEIMYGVNTGIGELAEVVLTPEQVEKFQKYLLYSHAAGCGEPCAEEDVRAGMLSRLNTHCWGHSGIRREVVEIQIEMLNRGVTPVVCQKGSVGACGDLSPMAQMAITLMGEGEVFYQGQPIAGERGSGSRWHSRRLRSANGMAWPPSMAPISPPAWAASNSSMRKGGSRRRKSAWR